jgi:dolichol-phosphate mannosyltransferase
LKILTLIPVYRDIAAAITVLSKFKRGYVDLIFLVVDGPKKSDEKEIRQAAKGIDTPVLVVVNKERKGIGSAIRLGIDYGIANKFDVIVVLSGNNKDNPDEIPRLLAPILDGGFDYIQGSRFLPGGKRVNNPFIRGVFSRIYPFIWTLFTKKGCTDVTNGFRAYRLNMFSDRRLDIHQNWLNDYQLEYYIHFKALTLGYKTKEVPVSKTYAFKHKGGYSNISPFKDWWKIVGPLLYLKLGIKK